MIRYAKLPGTRTAIPSQLLTQNVVWNLLGTGIPLVVAIFTIPHLVSAFGKERFGILSLIWMTIGYFSLFDFGLGRALTKLVAERLGSGELRDIPDLIVTALTLIGAISLAAAAVLALATPSLIARVLNVPPNLQAEGKYALYIMAAGLPFVIFSAGLVGLLEAHQRFKAISLVRVTLGSFTYLAPMLALQWTNSLVASTALLACGRMFASSAYLIQCLRFVPSMRQGGHFRLSLVHPIASFGGWLTVSSVISPLMVYMDRFVIGAKLSMAAVTYYTTPYDMVTRVTIFPVSLVGVFFPAYTAALSENTTRVNELFSQSTQAVLTGVLLPISLIVLFAAEGLTIWLGPDFARSSSSVLRWLAIGVFLNSMARLPHALIQSAGRPDLIAKLHLLELIFYLPTLWVLIQSLGIVGAAMAWSVRTAVDTIMMFCLSAHFVPAVRRTAMRTLVFLVLSLSGFGILLLPTKLHQKVLLATVLVIITAFRSRVQMRTLYRHCIRPSGLIF